MPALPQGATTFSITTLSIMALRIKDLIATLSMNIDIIMQSRGGINMTNSITTMSTMTFNITTLSITTLHNDILHNDTQPDGLN